ncbi:MAG: hypothetical protein KAW17_13670, partial [Candidatus Eisenbacteria sp.]|nr:hypothetical protein [Candidatus Eisenbacteria bacterium]
MKISVDRGLLILGVVLILGGIAYGLANNLETQTTIITRQVSAEVRRDPYQAMRRWAEGEGIAVLDSPAPLLNEVPAGTASVILDAAEYYSPFFRSSLIAWVHSGGHLTLVFPQELTGTYLAEEETWKALLKFANVKLVWGNGNPIGSDQSSLSDLYRRQISQGSLERPDAPPLEIHYAISHDVRFMTQGAAEVTARLDVPGTAAALLQVRLGEGTVTFTGTPRYLENDYIGELDNGQWTWLLVGGGGGDLLFLLGGSRRMTFAEFVRYWWTLPLGLLVFVLLSVWRLAVRRDALLDISPPVGSDISR